MHALRGHHGAFALPDAQAAQSIFGPPSMLYAASFRMKPTHSAKATDAPLILSQGGPLGRSIDEEQSWFEHG